MKTRPFLPALRCLGAVLLLALSACEDDPTGPDSYVQVAGGATWVAVAEPPGMPRAETWLPYVPAGSPAALVIRAMRESAARLRAAGKVEEALVVEADAMRLAVASVGRAPEPQRVLGALAAVEAWTDRARARLEGGSHPALDSAAAGVGALAASARAALARGDTLAALGDISRASLRAREHAPLAVGLRLLATAEARVHGVGKGPDADRIRRLIGGAREGLAMGDSVRALRRALYAVQMLDELAVETVDRRGTPR